MKNALVTGASGFIGRHVTAELKTRGYDVCEVDLHPGAHQLGDDAREFFFDHQDDAFDVVVHAAAHVGGRADIEGRPTFVGAYNLQLDGALFEWAMKAKPQHLVYLSSSAVYPVYLQNDLNPMRLHESLIRLSVPELPDETYGWTKLTGERLANEYWRETGQKVYVVRPFSGYGTDQAGSYPFGAFRDRALSRVNPFPVWGDGQQVRDWVHVDDVIGAVCTMLDDGVVASPTNICTGRGTSMLDLIHLFIHAVGDDYLPTVDVQQDAPTGVQYRVGDPTRLHQFYWPKVSIEDGVHRAVTGT